MKKFFLFLFIALLFVGKAHASEDINCVTVDLGVETSAYADNDLVGEKTAIEDSDAKKARAGHIKNIVLYDFDSEEAALDFYFFCAEVRMLQWIFTARLW